VHGNQGLMPIKFIKVGFFNKNLVFLLLLCLLLVDSLHFWGYWAFLEAKFLEEVGDEKPTSRLYKPGLFEAMEE
jgi:hypothetical protein